MNLKDLLMNVISTLNEDWENEALANIDDETNIFIHIDSISLLSIIIETESALEGKLGHYIALADEKLMDSQNSPFLSFKDWVNFVAEKIGSQ